MHVPTLTTERLVVAPTTLDHWEAYARAWADPRLTEFIGGKPRSRHESWTKFLMGFGLWEVLGYGYWSFLDRASNAFLGIGGLARFERGIASLEGFPESGWVLVPDAWGKGLATEAMTAVLAWSDAHLDAPETRCIIAPDNAASRRVAEKVGYKMIGAEQDTLGHIVVYARARRQGGQS